MSDRRCAVCGHVNSPGAQICDMCDSRLDGPPGAEWPSYTYDEGPREDSGAAGIPSMPFKGMGDVIAPMLEIYRKNFLLVVALVVVSTVPPVLLQYGLLSAMAPSDDGSAGLIAPGDAFVFALTSSVLIGLLTLAGSALLSGSLAYAVFDLRRTGATSAGDCLRRGLRTLPKLFLIDVMYAVVVGVGLLLLIVPGVILSLMFALVIPVAVAENLGPFDSFKRSMELTNGYKGLIFLTFFLWGIAIAVINLIISGSFSYGGHQSAFVVVMAEALVGGILNSTTAVLTVYIFLGLLHERSQGFDTRAFTPEGDPAAR
jgi:hypothetical protein